MEWTTIEKLQNTQGNKTPFLEWTTIENEVTSAEILPTGIFRDRVFLNYGFYVTWNKIEAWKYGRMRMTKYF